MRLKCILYAGIIMGLSACSESQAQSLDLNSDAKSALSQKIEAGDYGAVSSLWIEQDGKILFEGYFRDADKTTLHNTRSVGKTITGMLLGAAIDDGLIRGTDQKAADYFDDLKPFPHPDPRKDTITLGHLLSMSGPLECDDWNNASRGNEERMYLVEDWSAFFWELPIKNRPSWEIPDDDGGYERLFSYCTAGAQLIGEIVERASGKTIEDYAKNRFFDPIGITNPKWNYAATGKAHMGGGLELTTEGWAQVGRLIVNDGQAGGKEVLSKNWIAESLSNHTQTEPGTGYGYFWWRPGYTVGETSYTVNMMSGSGGNRIYVLPEFDIVAVITKNDFRDRSAHDTSDTLFREVIVSHLAPQK